MKIRVAARASKLSRVQVQEVLDELKKVHPESEFELLFVSTPGDRDKKSSLRDREKSDFFSRDLDELCLSGLVSVAIHSAKDLPCPLPKGLEIFALTKGVDPSDVLVYKSAHLPSIPKIGTSSKRREEQVCELYPGAKCVDIRGTIEERLALIDKGVVDAVVMAKAALIRLKISGYYETLIPGPTALFQGRLAIVGRVGDEVMRSHFRPLHALKHLYTGLKREQVQSEELHIPFIKIKPRPYSPKIEGYTHILFTSQVAVELFFAALKREGLALNQHKGIAIGKKTAAAMSREGVEPEIVAERETQEGLIERLQKEDMGKAHILIPRSSLARPLLTDFLKQKKVKFETVDLYDTESITPDPLPDLTLFEEVTLTSPSCAKSFLAAYTTIPQKLKIKTIGPVTKDFLTESLKK